MYLPQMLHTCIPKSIHLKKGKFKRLQQQRKSACYLQNQSNKQVLMHFIDQQLQFSECSGRHAESTYEIIRTQCYMFYI